MSKETTAVHSAVREHYGELARAANSCCGSSDSASSTLYDEQLLQAVPTDISGFSPQNKWTKRGTSSAWT